MLRSPVYDVKATRSSQLDYCRSARASSFLSGYPNGDLNTVVFTPTEDEFAAVSRGEPVIFQTGIALSNEVWQYGNLGKRTSGSRNKKRRNAM